MTRYIEAPERTTDETHPSLFLAGGITGCPDWQQEARRLFTAYPTDVTLFNPRRHDFPIHDRGAALAQITWEHEHLRKASAILFWFAAETVQPIVLYELGAWSMTQKPIYVGVDHDYPRRQDVIIQTRLVRPDVVIVHQLSHLCEQVEADVDRWPWPAPGAPR